MFHDHSHNLNHKVQLSFFFQFILAVRSFFILLFENSSTSYQAISVSDFSRKIIHKNKVITKPTKCTFPLNFNLRDTETLKPYYPWVLASCSVK